MSWSHILAFVIGVSVTIGGYETNRMFAQPTARTAVAQKAAAQKKKAAKPAAAAAAKKKAVAKRKKAASAAAQKANGATDADGRKRRLEARTKVEGAPKGDAEQPKEE